MIKIFYIIILLFLLGCNSRNISVDIPKFNQDVAFKHLVNQCNYGPRNPGSDGHREFSKYLESFLKTRSENTKIQEFSYLEHITDTERTGKNLIAQFNLESSERLLIGAHWDTRAVSDEELNEQNKSKPVIGANDGASGTAVLMELATIFSQNEPPIGVDLVFFDAEDVGINGKPLTFAMGSEFFSKNLPIEKPKSAIIVDMVGDKYLNIPIERLSYNFNPELVKELWTLAKDLSLNAFDYKIGYEIYDDHVPLWENAQIPAIDIIDFDYPNLFYNHWHTQNDIPENCSPQSLHQVGTLLLNYIYAKANK